MNDANDIVCDTLAHERDPWQFLRRLRESIGDGQRLTARIPNVRHQRVVAALLKGSWQPAADSPSPPLRFFTRREIEKLFYRAGLVIETLSPRGPEYDEWLAAGRPGSVRCGPLAMSGLSPEDAEEFHATEYLVTARAAPPRRHELTSVVILTHNQLDYTRQCVESILEFTDEPIELIFVDNASTDGTVDYLRSLPQAQVIANAENRGFPAAANQGIRVARGQNILLLNNDCLATTGWLDRLLRALDSRPEVGMVGPCSNNVSGPQQIAVAYESIAGLDGFAWEHGKANDGRRFDADRLVGFCLLVKRELIDKIGLLDERFGVGCFEDDDWCLRAVQAGYRLLIAADAFVHHYGSRTFLGSGTDLGNVLDRNEQLFRQKWRPDAPADDVAWDLEAAPGGGLLLKSKDVLVSLCMICRDNAGTIKACLESIRPWVDEMIVVDTGSRDSTPQLVEKCGARLFHFPWCDDFSAARNESIKYARGRWIFWMDSDDTIDPECGRKLRELARTAADPRILGYVMQVHCPGGGDEAKSDVTVVDHVKLFRNRPELRFEHRIHEQILPAIRRAGGEVAFTDIFVVHSGADHTPEGYQRKLKRDFHLLELDLRERPDHPFVLFNIGMTHADAGHHEEAQKALRRCIEVSQPGESHVRKAYALLIGSLNQLGRQPDAWGTCQQARGHYPDDTELLFREAVLHHHFGRLAEAEQAYRRVLDNREARHFASVDQGIHGFKTRHNLALVCEDLGRLDAAEQEWRRVVSEMPTYRLGWRGLIEILLRQDKLDAADDAIGQLLRIGSLPAGLYAESLTLRGRIATARGELAEARRFFEEAAARWPDDVDAKHALCRFLFEHSDPAEAELPLEDLLRLTPDDGSVHHNLGLVHLRKQDFAQAASAFRESLRHRPDAAATQLQLSYALEHCGSFANAPLVGLPAAEEET